MSQTDQDLLTGVDQKIEAAAKTKQARRVRGRALRPYVVHRRGLTVAVFDDRAPAEAEAAVDLPWWGVGTVISRNVKSE